jgi:hypothetical protein
MEKGRLSGKRNGHADDHSRAIVNASIYLTGLALKSVEHNTEKQPGSIPLLGAVV